VYESLRRKNFGYLRYIAREYLPSFEKHTSCVGEDDLVQEADFLLWRICQKGKDEEETWKLYRVCLHNYLCGLVERQAKRKWRTNHSFDLSSVQDDEGMPEEEMMKKVSSFFAVKFNFDYIAQQTESDIVRRTIISHIIHQTEIQLENEDPLALKVFNLILSPSKEYVDLQLKKGRHKIGIKWCDVAEYFGESVRTIKQEVRVIRRILSKELALCREIL
jgi:hypothetical protein